MAERGLRLLVSGFRLAQYGLGLLVSGFHLEECVSGPPPKSASDSRILKCSTVFEKLIAIA